MSDQVFVRRAVIKNFDVRGGLDEDFGMGGENAGRRRAGRKTKESPAIQRGTVWRFRLAMVLGRSINECCHARGYFLSAVQADARRRCHQTPIFPAALWKSELPACVKATQDRLVDMVAQT